MAVMGIILGILVPAFVGVGAYYQWEVMPYVLITSVIAFVVLLAWGKIPAKYYPYFIYSMTLSLMWQTSMLGVHIIGSDMQGEYYSSSVVLQDGVWHPTAHYGTQSSTSFVVGWLAPNLAGFLNIDVVWIYKIILPIIFSFALIFLYYAYCKQIGERKAVLACVFFMVVPIASLEVVQIGKMMVAEMFMALAVMLLVIKLKWYWQLSLFVVATVGTMFSHYTVGIALVAYIGGILIIRLILLLFKRYFVVRVMPISFLAVALVIVLGSGIAYYSVADEGVIMKVMKNVVPVYTLIVADTVEDVVKTVPSSNSGAITGKVGSSSTVINESEIPDNYIGKMQTQEALIKTATGFDFADASISGKAFRIIQYLTQLLIILGLIRLVFWYKKYQFTADFTAGVLASFVLLMLCVFLPEFSLTINATRFYQLALFFVAPVFILSFDFMDKKWILPTVIVVYFIFTSGLVFEVTKSEAINRVDTPYSASLSAKRTGVYATYTEDDLKAVKWLVSQKEQSPIVSDYNGGLLVAAYIGLDRIRAEGLRYNINFTKIPDKAYIYLTSWNTETGKFLDAVAHVRGGAGLRECKDLPVLNYKVVYQSGNAVIMQNK